MKTFTVHVTPRNGITRRIALIALDIDDARREAQLLCRALFRTGFAFCVWPA